LIPNCAEAGVIGALPGILGTLQAMQAINLILGIGEPLIGRLLLVDALNFRFRELPITRSVDCACCVQHLPFKSLPRPAFRCNLDNTMTPEISVTEFIALQAKQPVFVLDVRQPEEYQTVNMQGHLIPLSELEDRLDEIDQSKPIIVHCHMGMRSAKAVALLAKHGIAATNLQGGIQAWLDYHDNAA
ncbi:MAG: molybdenum cofactor biosynthesis protein MoeB, partial [Gammaproteobacteria bacterium]|nr:molybdenum cofactor biosynthesis protein MoeB [Gammaproteobacteria bacterium]